jgi:hypothetical protein
MAVQNVLFLGLMMLTIEASELRMWSQYLYEDKSKTLEHKYALCLTYFARGRLQTWWRCVNFRLSPKKKVYTVWTEVMKYLQKQNKITIIIIMSM